MRGVVQFELRASASPHEQLHELTTTLISLGIRGREAIVLLTQLLSLLPGDRLAEVTWSPPRQKRA